MESPRPDNLERTNLRQRKNAITILEGGSDECRRLFVVLLFERRKLSAFFEEVHKPALLVSESLLQRDAAYFVKPFVFGLQHSQAALSLRESHLRGFAFDQQLVVDETRMSEDFGQVFSLFSCGVESVFEASNHKIGGTVEHPNCITKSALESNLNLGYVGQLREPAVRRRAELKVQKRERRQERFKAEVQTRRAAAQEIEPS